MIHVDRSRVAVPPSLIAIGGPGKSETKAAIDFYNIAGNLDKGFETYKAYKEVDVRAHLDVLFDKKCAYCEIGYGGAPLDIEHYRPKGEIVEVDPTTYRPFDKSKKVPDLKPGYYWLAARWENLLLSCIDCNRLRTHDHVVVNNQVTGKGNYFPLATGNARARRHTQHVTLRNELPMLLNPCNDDPSQHLHFGAAANIFGDSDRGKATIEILGLQREPLVRERRRVHSLLSNSIENIKGARAKLKGDPNDAFAKALVTRELATIRTHYLDESSPFLAMSRALVRKGLRTG